MNYLHYGDNLDVLRRCVADESVDLVYLDPPFNSKRSYSVLFQERSAEDSQAQIRAFDDMWHWSPHAEEQYEHIMSEAPNRIADAIEGMRRLLGDNDVLAYLVEMTPRLLELHRVLKPTGSLYLHCDPTASHYLKIVLDAVFGPTRFRNEIIWRRTGSHAKVRRWGPIHDVIFFYTKTDDYKWNAPKKPYMRGHVEEFLIKGADGKWRTNYYGNVLTGSGVRGGESGKPWRGVNPTDKGRHWAIPGALVEDSGEDMDGLSQHEKLDRLYEMGLIKLTKDDYWPMYERVITPSDGTPAPDLWAYQPYTQGLVFGTEGGIDEDVRWLGTRDRERLGFQTQKPVGLLRRIIAASSDKGDVVLDPFAGCGTTVIAAQQAERQWIGIDITFLAIDLVEERLQDAFGTDIVNQYETGGIPRDLEGARALCRADPLDFERWAVSRLGAEPNERQVGDEGGVDGVGRFPLSQKATGRVLVSVEGGRDLKPDYVGSLAGAVEADRRAYMGVMVTLQPPTPGMMKAAERSGYYEWPVNKQRFPTIQLITVEQLLAGERPSLPPMYRPYMRGQPVPRVDRQQSLDV